MQRRQKESSARGGAQPLDGTRQRYIRLCGTAPGGAHRRAAWEIRYGREFDRLLEHPDIEQVEIRETTITIITRPMSMLCADRRSGAQRVRGVRLTVSIATKAYDLDNCVRIRPLGLPSHLQLVELQTGGIPCFGNIRHQVEDLWIQAKYATLANLCLRFLRVLTEED